MRVLALLLATALAFSPGFADAEIRDPMKPRETVSLAGLDLTKPADARIALVRIKGAVARVCAERRMSTPVLPHREWRCRNTSLTLALDELDAPLVRAAAGERLKASQ